MAAFGNAVSDFQVVAQSGSGYIVAADLSASGVRKVNQIQVADQAFVFGAPVMAGVPLETLLGYLALTTPPDAAFAQTAQTVYLFFSSDAYPQAEANRVGIFFDGNFTPMETVDDLVDAPVETHGLLKQFALRIVRTDLGERVDFEIGQAIIREKTKIGYS